MKTSRVSLTVNGRRCDVSADISVAAALAEVGAPFRRALNGQRRAPLCGMGVCFECRATVDGQAHVRTCMTTVREGMQVSTDA